MLFRQIYMISHPSSFDLVSATQSYQYFRNWLNVIDHRFKKHIRVGAVAFIWSLWLYRNNKVFDDKNSSILKVIYRYTNTFRLWSSL
jgi:hypothetical protein